MASRSPVSWSHWLPLLVLLLAFALRVYKLGDQNIWWDEGYSVYVTRHAIGDLTAVAAADTHPPLYYWILHAWMGLGGQSELALRFPSVIFGVLTVALVYRLGRSLAASAGQYPIPNTLTSTLAALLLAISRFHIWWSQEIRMYSLATMWAAASMLALLDFGFRISDSRLSGQRSVTHSRLSLGMYALTVAAGLYSLYLFVFVVAAEAVFVAWVAWRQWAGSKARAQSLAWLTAWGAAILAAVLALLPWLAYTLPRLKSWSAASEFGPLTYVQVAWTALTLGLTEHVERYALLNLAFAIILVAGIIVRRRATSNQQPATSNYILPLTLCVLFVPLGGVFILLTLPQGAFYRPPLEARYQLLSAPALALILAASIAALWKCRKANGILAGVAVIGLVTWVLPGYYEGRRLRDDFQTMTRAIEAYAEPGDALLLVSGDRFPLFNFRYDVLPRRGELPDATTLPVRRVTPADVEQSLAPLAQAHRRVWLAEVEKNLQDPDGLLASWLDSNCHVVWREEYGYNRLTLYSADQKPPVISTWTGLAPYDLPVREAGAGDVAHLVAYLETSQPLTLTISLVQFDDSDVKVLETRGYGLVNSLTRLRFDVPVYAHTPPGEYHFVLSSTPDPWWYSCHTVTQRQESRSRATEPFRFEAQGNGYCIKLDKSLHIAGTLRPESVKAVPNRRNVQIGRFVNLLGYQAPTTAKPGNSLPVKLYWRTSDKIAERYTVFVQLIGAEFNPQTGGPLWAGHDSEPLDGGYPTTQWFVGAIIADTHVLVVPPDTPPGEYELWAGMYTQPNVERMPVYDAQGKLVGDHVTCGTIRVEGRK